MASEFAGKVEGIVERYGRETRQPDRDPARVPGGVPAPAARGDRERCRAGRRIASQVLSIATFYRAVQPEAGRPPPIHVCMGTACHVQGGAAAARRDEPRAGDPAGRDDAGHGVQPRHGELPRLLRPRAGGHGRHRRARQAEADRSAHAPEVREGLQASALGRRRRTMPRLTIDDLKQMREQAGADDGAAGGRRPAPG